MLALWDGGSGRSSYYLGACFASCCPVLSSRAPTVHCDRRRAMRLSATVTALWPSPCFLFLLDMSLNIYPNFFFFHHFTAVLWWTWRSEMPPGAVLHLRHALWRLELKLYSAQFSLMTSWWVKLAPWWRQRCEFAFPFKQITQKPVKWFISAGERWETWVPLKNIALDSLFKNKVIKLGFFWSLFSSGLTGLSLQPHQQKHFNFNDGA